MRCQVRRLLRHRIDLVHITYVMCEYMNLNLVCKHSVKRPQSQQVYYWTQHVYYWMEPYQITSIFFLPFLCTFLRLSH